MTRVSFRVVGKPEPRGSKNAFHNPKTGRTIVSDSNPNSGPWMGVVSAAASSEMQAAPCPYCDGTGMLDPIDALDEPHRCEACDDGRGLALLEGPLGLVVIFTVRRPQGHFGTGRNEGQLKPSAPSHPAVRPDTTKLLRGVEDALSGVVWRDDAQVVDQAAAKRYGEPEGAQILVWTL